MLVNSFWLIRNYNHREHGEKSSGALLFAFVLSVVYLTSFFPSKVSKNLKMLIMKQFIPCFCLLIGLSVACSQKEITGPRLLQKSIAYHDPQGNWDEFRGILSLTSESPGKPEHHKDIVMRNGEGYFRIDETADGAPVSKGLRGDTCFATLGNSSQASEEQRKKYGLDCKSIKGARDFYGYLYGLPMKLKDPGTRIDEKVTLSSFNNKQYYTLRVTYEEGVGSDIWYFYFDPQTYALEGYKFYHGDEAKNEGEYVTLEGETVVERIRIPKVRKWYLHKEDQYLGTDILTAAQQLPAEGSGK